MATAVCACALLGIPFERIMRPLIAKSTKGVEEHLALFASIFAVYLALKMAAILWWGVYPKVIPTFAPFMVEVGSIRLRADLLVVSFAGFLLIISLMLFLKKTKLGKAIRAVSQNRETASILGININRIACLAFMISSGLAGVAGAFLGEMYRVDPYVVDNLNLIAFIIVLLGGLRSVAGIFFASLCIGVAQSLLTAYISSEFTMVILFLFIVVFLLFKPAGIFAEEERK
jgi:branched-chain amino acid transport system permease protein